MSGHYPVIIIGAGVAGLSAGRTLWDAGMRDFMILEAAAVSGGRVAQWQDETGRKHDSGASFLHSAPHNPLAHYLKSQGAKLRPLQPQRHIIVNGAMLDTAALAQFNNYYDKIGAAATEMVAGQPLANAAALLNGDPIHNAAVQAFAGATETGVALNQLSLLDVSQQIEDGGDCVVTGGFAPLLNSLAQDLPIMFDCAVKVIDSRGTRINLTTAAGEISCDMLIITCAVDVLLDGVTFVPALPPRKQAALQHLRQGLLNKIILNYEKPLWPQDECFYAFITDDRYGQYEAWVLPETPYTLMLICGGTQNNMTLDDFMRQFQAQLMTVLPALQGNKIMSHHITDWQHNPYTRGSYSALRPGLPDARAVYDEPIDGCIFFAGEVSDTEWATQVAGAYVSGQETAREIVTLFTSPF